MFCKTLITFFLSCLYYLSSSAQVNTTGLGFSDKIFKLKMLLSSHKWYFKHQLDTLDEECEIIFKNENTADFNAIGCSQAGGATIQFVKDKPNIAGIKLEINNPDFYLLSANPFPYIHGAGSIKVINDKEILMEFTTKTYNDIWRCGENHSVFKLVRKDLVSLSENLLPDSSALNKYNGFDIKNYLKNRYPPTNPKFFEAENVKSEGAFEIYNSLYAEYFYQRILDNEQNILGYNVLGAKFYYSGQDTYSKSIVDPHFIDRNGTELFKNEFLFKSVNDSILIFVNLRDDLNLNFHLGNGYVDSEINPYIINSINTFYVYKYSRDIKNRNLLFKIDNSQRDNDDKIRDIYLLGKGVLDTTTNQYFIFSRDDYKYNEYAKGIIDMYGNIIFDFKDHRFKEVAYLKKYNGLDLFYISEHNNNGNDINYHYGIAKSDGTFLYEPKFDDLHNINYIGFKYGNENVAKIKYHGRFGFMDKNYNVTIQPKYYKSFQLNSKWALARKDYNGYQHQDWVFVNLQTSKEVNLNIENVGLYFNGDSEASDDFTTEYEFSLYEPLIPVKINDKWGYCDNYARIAIPPQYSFATMFHENIAFVSIYHLPNKSSYLINKQGKIIATLSNKLSNDMSTIGEFSEGLMPYESREKQLYGYINSKGLIAIEPQFERAGLFHDGRASVQRYSTTFYIDKSAHRIDK